MILCHFLMLIGIFMLLNCPDIKQIYVKRSIFIITRAKSLLIVSNYMRSDMPISYKIFYEKIRMNNLLLFGYNMHV